jgi:hypothetical protein
MNIPLRKATVATLSYMLILAGNSPAFSQAWAVARSPNAFPGSCFVGQLPFPSPVREQFSQILQQGLANRKAGCNAAKALKTDEPLEVTKCFTYSTATIVDCKSEGVDLVK